MKVYMVMGYDGEDTEVINVFLNKKRAKKGLVEAERNDEWGFTSFWLKEEMVNTEEE